GPFLAENIKPSIEDMNHLFESLAKSKPDFANFNFSFEENEQDYLPFMKSLGASYNFTDYHLITTKDMGEVNNTQNIIEYQPAFYRYFSKLHNEPFKHDIMTTDESVNHWMTVIAYLYLCQRDCLKVIYSLKSMKIIILLKLSIFLLILIID